MMKGNSHGFNWGGLYVTGMIDHHAGWRERADELPDTVKVTMLLGEYFTSRYRGRYYAKCQNLARRLRSAYDAALQTYDVLLMPTVPVRASELPKPGCAVSESLTRAFEMLANTAPFDVSGHPAMSLPCGWLTICRSGCNWSGAASMRRRSTAAPMRMNSLPTGVRRHSHDMPGAAALRRRAACRSDRQRGLHRCRLDKALLNRHATGCVLANPCGARP